LLLAPALTAAVAANADGYLDPPYNLYPYVPDPTDTPPLYYTKVCEPGKTAESDASYVVVGIWYPRSYQGVSTGYAGDLVIPETIDGLPVRKIKEGAFTLCQSLTSVSIPSNCREIGANAFTWCSSLTNVTIAEGTTYIGDFAFSNCVKLTSITFPKSLAHLGKGCFEKANALTDVYFKGNAPRLDVGARPDLGKAYFGEKLYNAGNPQRRPTFHIDPTTIGWLGQGRTGAPEKWPLELGWMQAYPVKTFSANTGLNFILTLAE